MFRQNLFSGESSPAPVEDTTSQHQRTSLTSL